MFNLISLDGYFAGIDGNIDWHQVDDEFNEFAIEQTESFGGIIFGKTTYKLFEDFWPKVLETGKYPDGKKAEDADLKIAKIIDETWKFVYSKSLDNVTWKNTNLRSEINPEEVKGWKQYDGKDMVIFGSGTIVQQFTNLGLIDEYRFIVVPVILGQGKPLFKDVKETKLKLLSERKFRNGNVLLVYEKV